MFGRTRVGFYYDVFAPVFMIRPPQFFVSVMDANGAMVNLLHNSSPFKFWIYWHLLLKGLMGQHPALGGLDPEGYQPSLESHFTCSACNLFEAVNSGAV